MKRRLGFDVSPLYLAIERAEGRPESVPAGERRRRRWLARSRRNAEPLADDLDGRGRARGERAVECDQRVFGTRRLLDADARRSDAGRDFAKNERGRRDRSAGGGRYLDQCRVRYAI